MSSSPRFAFLSIRYRIIKTGISIIIIIASFLTFLLPDHPYMYYGISLISIICMTIMSLISAIDYKKVVNVRLIYTITTALLVVYPFVSYKPYFYMVNKINIERYLDEEYSSVKYTIKKSRKIYIDLLTDNEPIIQPELFCGNSIKTTNYNM